jgi:hypothetical protein
MSLTVAPLQFIVQPAQSPPMSQAQKLKWYSEQLVKDASQAEKEGRTGDAVATYLKAADIFLLLSKVEQNYTSWLAYTDKANFCQKRVKLLLAAAPQTNQS